MVRDPELDAPVHILLVDDHLNNLLALEALLEGPGRSIIKAVSGNDALRWLLDRDCAVLLLDVQMPGLNGFELASLIRGRERSGRTPIIFLTAHEVPDFSAAKAYTLGAVDYLVKPVAPEILRSKVAVFIDLYRQREEIRHQAELLRRNERLQWEVERLREEAARKDGEAAELTQANRRKTEFIAMMSHELRNPLAPVLNGLHILRMPGIDPTIAEQTRAMMERQIRHLVHLVDDLLDVSRLASGKIELRLAPLDLAELVRTTVEDHRSLLEQSGVSLVVKLPDSAVRVPGDAARLAQALYNLLHNASKFTDPGGTVFVNLSLPKDGGQARLTVRDTGAGMKAETLARLFEPFAQGAQDLDRSRGGLGLGLAVVKGLVELHGGTVAAESRGVGQGSQFVITLPVDRTPAS